MVRISIRSERFSYECIKGTGAVVVNLPLGSFDLFLGEVVSLHVKEEVPTEKGGIDMTKALPILFSPGSREYWSLGRPLGHYGFTKGKP